MSLAVLNSRIKKMECENKPIPQKYVDCFNDYIKKIINIRVDQEVKYLNDIIADKFELGKFKSVNELIYAYKSLEKEYTKSRQRIAELEQELAESEKRFVVANNLRKKSDEVLLNYKTEKYGLDKTIQELRKIKLSMPEKEWYYKGFENCERQISSHIADLTLENKQLKQQLEEKDKLLKCYQDEEKLIAKMLGDKDLTIIGSRVHLENLIVELKNKIRDRDLIIEEKNKQIEDWKQKTQTFLNRVSEQNYEIANNNPKQLAITELENAKMMTEWKFRSVVEVVDYLNNRIKELKGE